MLGRSHIWRSIMIDVRHDRQPILTRERSIRSVSVGFSMKDQCRFDSLLDSKANQKLVTLKRKEA
jgi:hypothetical protein